jgi:hypothetical protein
MRENMKTKIKEEGKYENKTKYGEWDERV